MIFGASRSGKTTYVKQRIQAYPKQNGKVLVIDCLGAWRPTDGVTIWVPTSKAHFLLMLKALKGFKGLLIIDDIDLYSTAGDAPAQANRLIVGNGHLGIDLIVISRRPQGVWKNLEAVARRIFLFRQHQTDALDKIEEWLGESMRALVPHVDFHYLAVDLVTRQYCIKTVEV